MYENEFKVVYSSVLNCGNEDLIKGLYRSAINYHHYRAIWQIWSLNERNQNDEARTRAHNVFIDNCNIISRYMLKKGLDNSWRQELGEDRKIIGDFACYIAYRISLISK